MGIFKKLEEGVRKIRDEIVDVTYNQPVEIASNAFNKATSAVGQGAGNILEPVVTGTNTLLSNPNVAGLLAGKLGLNPSEFLNRKEVAGAPNPTVITQASPSQNYTPILLAGIAGIIAVIFLMRKK